VYQESMMRVAQKFAGYDLAQADNLRKACGKKIREAMAKEREQFVNGCVDNGYGLELGQYLFDIIEGFADYAFNKSHAYGYGLIAYQTAYLKAHYPVEYIACLLTSVKGSYDKAAIHLADARASNIQVTTPDINRSMRDFAASVDNGDRTIVFGLSAVRNVGEGIVEQLIKERDESGPFSSFHDFANRVPEPVLNKRAVESMIKAGTFDLLGHPRRGLLMVFERIIDTAVVQRRERDKGIMSLFGGGDDGEVLWDDRIEIPDLQFEKMEQLRFEKEMLGLYISDHPLMGAQGALRRYVDCSIVELESRGEGMVTIGGVITNLSRRFTKRGDQMATFVLEDLESSIEVTVFARALVDVGPMLTDDAIVAVTGRLNRRDENRSSFTLQKLAVLDNIHERAPEILVQLASGFSGQDLAVLKGIIADYPGASPVKIMLTSGKIFDTGAEFCVDLTKAIGPLRLHFGVHAVKAL
jgi:DNA polymerase-3 subunit alpha